VESRDLEKVDVGGDGGDGPVCLSCLAPVDRLDYYSCNQLTAYMPFVNIRWATTIWGRAWRQAWCRDVSIKGRVFRLFMIVWQVPILLVGLFFKETREEKKDRKKLNSQ